MIPLGDAVPALQKLPARMRAREPYSDDLPAAYVRLLYGLPEDAPVTSRLDQLTNENRTERRPT